MRTIKSGLYGLILLVIASSALFLTCDVGLGNSVDTKPPTVTITYPPVQSVIKNAFTMSGAASDDTSLASVTVGVVNTVTAVTYGPYAATIEPTKGAWSLVVNNRTASGYEIRDGTYEMTVTAVDGTGRKSVATTTYEIDNTPPVVVIDRPGTNGPIAGVTPEVYGTELKVTGSINDDHAIDKLVLTAYDPSGNMIGSPITQTNISGVAMDITLAKSFKAPATSDEVTLNALYNEIHNNPDANGTQNYYCTITASDSAREYNPPSAVASADNTRGNINAVYYVYDDVYSAIFSATGYAVTMKDLTAMFNGSYADTAKSAVVLAALAAKARPAASWSTASATFSLNPKNSPSFSVQGYDSFTNGSDITLAKNQKANATDLTVVVHTGRDAIPLNKDSLKVTLVPCSASAVATGVGATLLPSLAECADVAARDAKITKSGTDYLMQVTVNGDANSYYRIEVTGADQSGNAIDNLGAMYGFMVVTNGLPPTIVVLTPTLNSYATATVASHSVTFSGTIDSENGTPELMLSGYTEAKVDGTRYTIVDNAAFNKDIPATYIPITLIPSGTTNRWNWSYTIDTLHNLSDANAKSVTATAVGNGEDLYTYNMILYARNKTNSPAQATPVFFVDSAPPTAELVSVTPTTTASPPPYVVNGIVSAVLRFADNDRIATATYQLGSEPVQNISTLNGCTIPNIDTRLYNDATGMGTLPLTITLTDRAGLVSVFHTNDTKVPTWLINIDQSLDKPKLAVNYANTAVTTEGGVNASTNLYGRDGYTAINGTVSDDDGIDSVIVHIKGGSVDKDFPATVTGTTFSCDLSTLAAGYYDIRITAKDNALGETTSIPGPAATFKIAYDTDLPVINIVNPDGQFQKTALILTGTRSDGSGISSFTYMNGATPVTVMPDVPGGNNWHINIPKPSASEQTTLTFTAKDTYGRTTTKAFTYKYDLDAPTVNVTTVFAAQPLTNYFNQNYALAIKGEAAEAVSANPQSGLSEIQYAIYAGLNATLTGTPDWKTATGSASWVANVDLTNSVTYLDGPYTVFIRSVDLMGNASIPVSYNITGDRVAPELTETQINTSNTVYKPATFDIGGAISDTGSGIASFSYTRNGVATGDAMGLISGTSWTLHEATVPDGAYTYIFTAKDKAGIVSTVTRKVTIDSTNPTASITSPVADGAYIKADSFNFKGAATDPDSGSGCSGVGTINLTINSGNTAISPIPNWSSVQDLTGLTEGTLYTAKLDVKDNAGNTATVNRTFKVDRANPRATIVPAATAKGFTDSSVFYRETAFSLSGICDDAAITTGRKATSVVLWRSKDGAAATKIASTVPTDGVPFASTTVIADQAWSYAQSANAVTHGDDGLYVYSLVVTDDAGQSTTATATVRIDTTAPTVIVTAPTANEAVNVASYTLQGSATDLGSGIDTTTLKYTLDGGPATDLNLSGATWTAASVSLGVEGSKALVVSCADRLGNAITPVNVTFYYDLNKPELVENKVGSSTLITKSAFDVGGTCLDTNQMKEIDISATRSGTLASAKTWTWAPIVKAAKNASESWTQAIDLARLSEFDGSSNGTYTFNIVATDIAGKTTTVQRTVIVDTEAPTLSDPTVTTGAWLKNAVQTVSGTVSDNAGGSGIASVEYAIVMDGTLDTELWSNMTVTGTTYSGAISFSDGMNNVIYVRATDRANNVQIKSSGKIWVDTQNPEVTITNPLSVVTLNGTKDLSIEVSGTDAATGSGIAGFAVSRNSDMSTPIATISLAGPYASTATGSMLVPKGTISALSDGSQKLYVQATDAAGRTSASSIVNILVDKKTPTGKVTSHGPSAIVNKTIAFSGTASDENGLPTASVAAMQVWKGTAGTKDPSDADAGWELVTTAQQPALTISGSYSWSVTGFDTTKYAGADYDARSDETGFQLCLRVLVVDNAGNTGYITQKFVVDQDSDKPIVKLTNLATTGSPTLVQTKVIYGTITDDDGLVTALAIKNSTSDSWTDVAFDGQSFAYTVTGSDGAKQLYFKITDKAGTTFTTDMVSSATTPRLYEAADSYLETPLSFNLDTTPPDISSDSIGIKVSGSSVYNAYSSTNAYYGGAASGKFDVQFMASSANTVASASVSITDSASVTKSIAASLGAPVSVTADVSDTLTASATHGLSEGSRVFFTGTTLPGGLSANVPYYVISTGLTSTAFKVSATLGGSAVDITSAGSAVYFTTGWTTSSPIDITTLVSGAATLSITTTDTPGLSTTTSKSILIDNAKPTISVTSNKMNDQVTGDVVFNGTSDDGSGSGVTVVKYHVGKCADLNAATWTTLSTQLSWAINFTSAASNVITTTASYANSTYADETSTDSNVWILPIYLRAIDKAGNVQDYTFYLNVDPDGDKPTVSVSYPLSGTTLGGNIRIFGSATDNVSVASVWMEIDTNNDGKYDSTDIAALSSAGYGSIADLANGFKIDGTASWSKTINGSKEFNAPSTTVSATTITSGVRYKIATVGTTNYMALGATSNAKDVEFTANTNATSSAGSGTVYALTNLIQFRVRACDNQGTYGTWAGYSTIKIDNLAPRIGSTTPLKLVQYTDGTFTTVAKEQSYVSDMYIRGQWYLVGSVEDESGIKVISVSGSATGTLVSQPSWFVQGTAVGSYHNYTFRIPVGKALADTSCGAQTYSIYVEDGSDPTGTTTQPVTLNYDNKAPVAATLTHGGTPVSSSNLVVQSNNTYTFSSTVTEDGSSDSGFSRLVFFFVRQKSDGTNKRVYNPMLPINGSQAAGDVAGNRTYISNLTWDADDVPRLVITGATRSGEDSLTHTSIINNENVRVGGLVRIAGIDRLIKTVDTGSGTITFSPSVSTSYTDASLLYGLVVDNTTVEVGVWNGSKWNITNDDGDGMVESVVKSGGTWTWDASVNSKNIPDGPISLYYVAYDKAGNTKSGYVQSSVANSGPRIAKIQLGTDLSGDGSFNAAEVSTVYTATNGSEPTRVDLTDQTFKMKGDLAVIPEFVGGNGTLNYVWTANSTDATAWDGSTYPSAPTKSSVATPLTSFPGVTVTGSPKYDYGLTLSAADSKVTAMNGALKLLSFTVWDSTEETTIGTDSQWALINVPINVAVTDYTAPNVIIDKFYWASLQSNSIYGTSATTMDPSTLSGHIELPGDLDTKTFKDLTGEKDLDPKVSGKITITGSAFDDQRLDSLWVTFDGFTPKAGTYLDHKDTVGADNKTYYKMATFNTSTSAWTYAGTVPLMATDSYTFTVTPDYLTQAGHRVTWKLCIDTAAITNSVALDARVRVFAYDRVLAPSLYDTVSASNVPYYQMDVVPYIKGVKTSLSTLKKTTSSIYDRTALGHYPVKSDKNAYFYGFNLVSGATVSDWKANTTTLGGADIKTFPGYTVYPAAVSTFKSGFVSVSEDTKDALSNTVHVISLNNLNTEDAKGSFAGTTNSATGDYGIYSNYYNRQPNNDNNNKLTDDVFLDVWKVKNSARSQSGTLTEPIMRIVPTAIDAANASDVMRFAFTNGAAYFSMAPASGTARSYQDWERNYADFNNVAFTYDSDGNSYGIATGLDTYPSGTSTYAGRMTFVSSRWGVGNNNMNDNYYGYHKVRLESIGILNGAYVQGAKLNDDYIMDTKRFSSPSLATAVHAGSTSVYLAYYDKFQKQIRFRYGTFDGTTTTTPTNAGFATNNPGNNGTDTPTLTGGGNFGQFVDQHTALDIKGAESHFVAGGNDNAARVAFDAAHSDYSLIAGKSTGDATHTVALGNLYDTGNAADKYVAIDVVSDTTDPTKDVVVAVWYDGSDLKYSYKLNPYTDNDADQTHTSTAAGYWLKPITIFTDGGKYCAIKVDSAGGIHIAAQDSSNQDLKYAYLSSYDAAYSEANAVTVDSYAIVGTQIQIDTETEDVNGNAKVIPYISYYSGSTMKPKMAYLVPQATMDYTAEGADSSTEMLTGKWEVTLVPTSSDVQDDHTNIGLWKTAGGAKRVNATKTGDDSVTGGTGSTTEVSYGNGTTNPVVGYAIVDGTQGYIETAQKE